MRQGRQGDKGENLTTTMTQISLDALVVYIYEQLTTNN